MCIKGLLIRLHAVSKLYETQSEYIATIFRPISYSAYNFFYYLIKTSVRKLILLFMVYCFVIIPYQLIELYNFSLFEHINQVSLTRLSVVKLEIAGVIAKPRFLMSGTLIIGNKTNKPYAYQIL